jgi:hypothetical protein
VRLAEAALAGREPGAEGHGLTQGRGRAPDRGPGGVAHLSIEPGPGQAQARLGQARRQGQAIPLRVRRGHQQIDLAEQTLLPGGAGGGLEGALQGQAREYHEDQQHQGGDQRHPRLERFHTDASAWTKR